MGIIIGFLFCVWLLYVVVKLAGWLWWPVLQIVGWFGVPALVIIYLYMAKDKHLSKHDRKPGWSQRLRQARKKENFDWLEWLTCYPKKQAEKEAKPEKVYKQYPHFSDEQKVISSEEDSPKLKPKPKRDSKGRFIKQQDEEE